MGGGNIPKADLNKFIQHLYFYEIDKQFSETRTFSLKATTADNTETDVSTFSVSWVPITDSTAPAYQNASVNGATLTLTYDEALKTDGLPAANDFTVKINGSAVTVSGVAINNADSKKLDITLATAVKFGQKVTFSYTDPTTNNDTNAIQDAAGNDAASLVDYGASNLTPATRTTDPIQTKVPGQSAVFAVGGGNYSINNVVNGDTPTNLGKGIKMPLGSFSFDITGGDQGFTADLSITLDASQKQATYYKYNFVTKKYENIAKGVEITKGADGIANNADDKSIIRFSLTDGGAYDADKLADGKITDPGGSADNVLLPVVFEGETAVSTVNLINTDKVTGTLSYAITGGADKDLFEINAATGALSFINAPDYENPTDTGDTASNNTYAVTVKLTSASGGSETQPLIVTVMNKPEAGDKEVGSNVTAVEQTVEFVATPVDDAQLVISGATSTLEDKQSELIKIATAAVDEDEITHFKITDIKHGKLYQADGETEILNDAFITAAQATAGLKFTPDADYNAEDSNIFNVQGSLNGTSVGDEGVTPIALAITAVNDAPVFTKGADQTVSEDAGTQTVTGFATEISAGGGEDEASQTLTFNITTNNNDAFATLPAIAANGDLTYKFADNFHGEVTISATLSDNGGMANGGVDTSATQTFTLTATPVNDAPTIANVPNTAQAVTVGQVAQLANFTVADVDSENLTVTLTATNGAIGNVVDNNNEINGIQVAGTIDAINTRLAAATFTANSAGNAAIAISVTDGIVDTPTTAIYNLTATNPPPPPADPEPTLPAPVVEPPKPETKPEPVVQKPISKEIEMQVPSASGVKGDGNGDGIADVEQKHVISLPTQKDLRETTDTPKVFLSIELPQGLVLTKAVVNSVADSTKEKPITFTTETVNDKGEKVVETVAINKDVAPFGLFEFNFEGVPKTTDSSGNPKGGTADVKLYLDDKQTVEKYLKQTVSGAWKPIPFSYAYDEKLGKTVVSISLTDGDEFDLDGGINGAISDPGTPIITPKLTVTPEPTPVVIAQPNTKIFVGYDRSFKLDSGAAQFFGQGEREVVELGSNALNSIIDQNIEQVKFAGLQSDYTFEQKGNSLQVAKGSVMIAQITVQDDANGSLLTFENGTQSAKFNAGLINLTQYTIVTDDVPRSIFNKTSVFTTQGSTVGVDSELVDVYGSSGYDVISLATNATKITIDQNVEQVNLAGKFADYRFVPAGNTLEIFVGSTQIASVNVQDDSDGTQFMFADGEHFAKFVQPTADTPLTIEITGVVSLL